MLILFDIDGTLLHSHGAGGDAFLEAAANVSGWPLARDSVEFAGGTDPVLLRRLLEAHRLPIDDDLEARFRVAYRARLERHLRRRSCTPLRGARELLGRLRETDGVTLGLLTGNYADTAPLKLRSAGIPPEWFPLGAFGDDGATRRDLPAVAMARCRALLGEAREGERVVIVGDTPHDVDCALHAGCRALGVATGPFDAATLSEHGAHHVVGDLTEGAAIVEWMTGGAVSSPPPADPEPA